jgi:hypothetical protein
MPEFAIPVLPPRVLAFRPQCPGCTPEKAVDPDGRPCSFYDCPGLPPELHVTCNECMYDFASGSGLIKCDHRTCETAQRLRRNVATYRAWLDLIAAEHSLR